MMKIVSFPNLFEDPSRIFFRNSMQLQSYHDIRIKSILSFFGINNFFAQPIITAHPPCSGYKGQVATLETSGTTSVPKKYHYPKDLYLTIERYHSERFIHFNGWASKGIIVWARRRRTADSTVGLLKPTTTVVFGPNYPVRWLVFDPQWTGPEWAKALREISRCRPIFLYGRPGELEIVTEKSLENGFYYDFPVVATGETLYPLVREKFLQVFTRVVDKMRCWDGGLSFFECREGRKHIYDELAFVEDLDGRLVSTDLFNLAHPFIRYANNDCGTYRCGDCGCGIFGNYFTEFKGKQIENLLTKSGKTLSGTHVLESIGVAVKEIPYEFNFTIRQHADKTITIHASIPLERTDRIPVMSILNRMINDVDISDLHSNIPLEWVFDREISEKKNLLVVSQAVKNVPATPWL